MKTIKEIQEEDRVKTRALEILKIYEDPARGLSPDATLEHAKRLYPDMKIDEVNRAIDSKYQAFRQYKPPKFRIKTRWEAPGSNFQMDLAEVVGKPGYLLNIIDIGSRYAFSYYMPNKKAETTLTKLKQFLKDKDEIFQSLPVTLHSDQGKEFTAAIVKELDVRLEFSAVKLAVIERFNRTLKLMIRNLMLAKLGESNEDLQVAARKSGFDFTKHLDSILENYNNRKHSYFRRKLTPAQAAVDPSGALDLIGLEIGDTVSPKYKVGDKVLVNLYSKKFQKESALIPTFGNESQISKIDHREDASGSLIPVYFLNKWVWTDGTKIRESDSQGSNKPSTRAKDRGDWVHKVVPADGLYYENDLRLTPDQSRAEFDRTWSARRK